MFKILAIVLGLSMTSTVIPSQFDGETHSAAHCCDAHALGLSIDIRMFGGVCATQCAAEVERAPKRNNF